MDLSLDFPSQLWAPFALSRPPIRCSAGYLIYLQNTEATCFYYLKSGRVKSYIQSADGAERVLNIYPAGSLFGEASFFDKLPRVSSAVALSPCELVPIDRELAAQAVSGDPELALITKNPDSLYELGRYRRDRNQSMQNLLIRIETQS